MITTDGIKGLGKECIRLLANGSTAFDDLQLIMLKLLDASKADNKAVISLARDTLETVSHKLNKQFEDLFGKLKLN